MGTDDAGPECGTHCPDTSAAFRARGNGEPLKQSVLSSLARTEALSITEQVEEALSVLTEALAWIESINECKYKAETWRLKGEAVLSLSLDNSEDAEACFHQALTVARQQQVKSWELRTAVSLARLWQRQGKCQDAYDLLAPVYNWFTEGLDTVDLQEARSLLDDLG